MLQGLGVDNSGFDEQDPAPETGAPLTFQFDQQKGLIPTQRDLLEDYFNEQILANFQEFIKAAPDAFKPLRQLIVAYAPTMACASFEQFISNFYPAVLPDDRTSDQNIFFRELLISVNRLCNKKIDINHPLYQAVFDPRISPTKSNSPTKQNLVINFFTKEIKAHFAFPTHDPFVIQALDWIEKNTTRFNPVTTTAESTAKRQLHFNF